MPYLNTDISRSTIYTVNMWNAHTCSWLQWKLGINTAEPRLNFTLFRLLTPVQYSKEKINAIVDSTQDI